MLRMGKKAEYALIAMTHMARLPPDQCASSRDMAARYDMPPEILGKVLQALSRGGLVRSLQGVKGGYLLARAPGNIMMGQILEAVEGPLHLAPCALNHHRCQQSARCNIRRPVFRLQDRLLAFISQLNFADFLADGGLPVPAAAPAIATTGAPPALPTTSTPAAETQPCLSPKNRARKRQPVTARPR